MLLREACQGSEFAGAGISDQDIYLSLPLPGFVESIEVLQFGDVSPNACNLAADRLDGFVEFLLSAACYEDIGTFIDEPPRYSEAVRAVPPVTTATFPCNLPILVTPFAVEAHRPALTAPGGRLLSAAFIGSCAVPGASIRDGLGRYASFLILTGSKPASRSRLRSQPRRRRKKSGRGLRRRIRYAASPRDSRGFGTDVSPARARY